MSSCNDRILIGVLDGEITEAYNVDWSVNKIGGKPILFGHDSIENHIQCEECKRPLVLVSQTYCPLESSSHHRILLIFACTTRTCWNKSSSWLALRLQKHEQTKAAGDGPLPKQTWLESEDNWSDDDNDEIGNDENRQGCSSPWDNDIAECLTETANLSLADRPDSVSDACSFAELSLEDSLNEELDNGNVIVCGGSLSSEAAVPNWLSTPGNLPELEQDFQPLFKEYFISVVNEPTAECDADQEHAKELLLDYEKHNRVVQSENLLVNTNSGEHYEKTNVKHGDKIFRKYQKKLAAYPHQVIRYSWTGKPLYVTSCDELDVPNCEGCGAKRVYEMQLMSPLVNYLQLTNLDTDACALEFGVAIVFSCSKSCWADSDKYKREYIFVQSDPDAHLFDKFLN